MSKDTLVVQATEGGFGVFWSLADGRPGTQLGDMHPHLDDCHEHDIASRAAYIGNVVVTAGGYKWPTQEEANAALASAQAAVLAAANKPWPEWAVTALEECWQRPRGWQP